jgi:ABC-type multidrug transport system fused ATPase/permease subunit
MGHSNRTHFIAAIVINWWDMLKATWLYWVGIFRFIFLSLGWLYGLVIMTFRIIFEFIKELILFPFRIGSQFSSQYFKPGVPWLAVLFTVFWAFLEAGIFTYILLPTISEVLSDLVGLETHTFLAPILFVMLFLLVAGSFACLQVLAEAMAQRKIKQIIQMLVVEFFVMFLEVFFLYRELVDAVTPWIAQHTDESFRMGLYSTLLFATFGWLGIRGMTWFLFGRYGTPSLLAIMARKRLEGAEERIEVSKQPEMIWAKKLLEIFKNDIEWFRRNSRELAEVAVLPVLQLIAVALNFFIILIAGETVFKIPFKNIQEVMETPEEILSKLGLKKTKPHYRTGNRSRGEEG